MLACKAVAVFYRINNNVAAAICRKCSLKLLFLAIITSDSWQLDCISRPRCSTAITSTVLNCRLITGDTFSGNAFKDLFAALDRASRHFRQGRPFQFPQYTSWYHPRAGVNQALNWRNVSSGARTAMRITLTLGGGLTNEYCYVVIRGWGSKVG